MNQDPLTLRYRAFWTALREATPDDLPRDHHRADWDGDHLFVASRRNLDRFAYHVRRNKWWLEYTLEARDRNATQRGMAILLADRAAIGEAYGGKLEWKTRPSGRNGTIRTAAFEGGVLLPDSRWPALQEEMFAAMRRLHAAIAERAADWEEHL